MTFLHKREWLSGGDSVVVNCSHKCNILLLDDSNFSSYRSGARYTYHGGYFEYFPARVGVPNTGNWNVVLDLGGRSANIRYSIKFFKT